MKKLISVALAAAMTAAMAAPAMADGVDLTFFNSKMEIDDALKEEAAAYSEEFGVNMTDDYSSGPMTIQAIP